MKELFVALYDIHFPRIHWATFNCALDFIRRNKVSGLVLGGDQHDNECISHHTKGKPIYRLKGQFKRETDGFKVGVLDPLEKALPKGAKKVWIRGNHERFVQDFVDEHPELDEHLDREQLYDLSGRGWQVIPMGMAYKRGKLSFIHGEWLTGIGNQAGQYPAKKLVEIFAGNALAGHTHAPQSFTRVSPINQSQKWMGWIAPIVGNTNAAYLRNRPTAWVNGFVIIEYWDAGNFNLYPIVTTNGKCSFGGKVYGEVSSR